MHVVKKRKASCISPKLLGCVIEMLEKRVKRVVSAPDVGSWWWFRSCDHHHSISSIFVFDSTGISHPSPLLRILCVHTQNNIDVMMENFRVFCLVTCWHQQIFYFFPTSPSISIDVTVIIRVHGEPAHVVNPLQSMM